MGTAADLTIIGFDLGHSETAVAKTNASSNTLPEPIPLAGAERGRPLLSLVGVRPDGAVLLGLEASTARPPIEIRIGFKTADLTNESATRPVRLFIDKVVQEAAARGHVPPHAGALWVFGVPSGWPQGTVTEFAALLKRLGLDNIKVTTESRAALLYARDCGEVKLDASQLCGPVLIVDIGSSTTDYTVVENLRSTPVDHGNIALGAGLIDLAIMRCVMTRGDLPPATLELVDNTPSEATRLELLCRRAKEAYFSSASDLEQDPYAERGVSGRLFPSQGRPLGVDVYLTKSDMGQVLETPLEALGGMTWPAAFRADLNAALEALTVTPDRLLVTGGPSQMQFVVDICREAVGPERVVVGSAPEFAIARGLALAGRAEVRTEGFRRDLSQLLRSREIPTLVAERLPAVAEAIGDLIAIGMTERHVIPMFLKWRIGEIHTLNSMTDEISKSINAEVLSGERSRLDELVAEWQNGLHARLEQKTRPICERWGIPPATMQLPQVKLAAELAAPVDASVVTETLNKVGTTVTAIVAVVVANVLFGAGTAVLASTGPFAVLVAAAFIFGGAMLGKEAIMKKAMTVSLPIWARQMALSDDAINRKIRAKSREREAELAASVAGKITQSGASMAEQISRELSKGLEAKAREAEMLILPPEVRPASSLRGRDGRSTEAAQTGSDSSGRSQEAQKGDKSGGGRSQEAQRGNKSGASRTTVSETGPKTRDRRFQLQAPDKLPTFADVGGMESLKSELRATVGMLLAFSDEAAAYRIEYNGLLLHGVAGTGKTYLARATAGELGMNFVKVGVANLVSKFAGESAQNIEAAFAFAASNTPCLLLFDEFDSVASRREDEPNEESRRVVNQLLTSLEHHRSNRHLLVVATTNDIERLDPAAIRAGRFDRHVRIDLPDLAARKAILAAQLARRPLAPALDLEIVAARCEGVTAAALGAIVQSAAMAAFRESTARSARVPITTAHLVGALTARGGKDRPTVEAWSWDRLVIDDQTKTELQQLQRLLVEPDRAAAFGIDPPRGLLLAGPPGTGKTTVARVLAAESQCSFYPTTGNDLTSKWVGESEAQVARLFARARDNAPSIVYIDEIDGVGAARGELGGLWADRLLNQLLAEIDGLTSRGRVMVMGSTNRPDILDPALTQRLSRTIRIGLPETAARKRLLELQSARMPLERVDLDYFARLTDGLSGRELDALCKQAAVAAMTRTALGERGGERVTTNDFESAFATIRQSLLADQPQDESMARFLDELTAASATS